MVFALSGCTPHVDTHHPAEETKSVTPEDARTDITDLYSATEALVGGHWKVGTEGWDDCVDASGGSGAAFSYHVQRLDQPLGTSADELTHDVQRLWKERGIDASIWVDRSVEPPMHYLSFPDFGTGTERDGYLVQFAAKDGGYADFDGTSHCAEGDSYELNVAETGPTAEPSAPITGSEAPTP
jgi:hypothetical protein